ncbi:MAG: heavy metal efflux pump, cobalt-zinc-cadmium [Edaphobacter sp.]|nr:heavy metal efflux pump, cobalt-zinc-cadmium [Edaphobacter sp.]
MGRMLDFLLDNRWLVFGLLLMIIVGGVVVMLQLPIEAFPDLTNNQVVVTVDCPGMSPVEVEQLVTYPMETVMMGLPKLQIVRSTSKLELSMVTVIFDDSMDRYLVRQLVAERLNQVQGRIPANLQPRMNPMATAFGEVYQYTLSGPKSSLMDLKTLQDWNIRFALLTIPGISEVNSWGGYTKQYTVEVDPESLRRYNLTLHDVVTAVSENNANFGGSYIEHAEQQYTLRGIGRVEGLADLGNMPVAVSQGTPVLLKQVANLRIEPMLRHGAVMKDGQGETVSGMVILLRGENGGKILEQIKEKVASLKLPDDVKITSFYDQSSVIDATIHTVKKNLFEAAFLVIVVLLIFLGDWRAAIVVALTIPLSLLFGFMGMKLFGISANLMSLGAIDFGTIVDGSVVMVENCIHHLESDRENKSVFRVVREAAREVSRPVIFGVLIIMAVYIPIFTLEGLEGRMFRPMAVTVVAALTGSLFLALFVVPTLCTYVLRKTNHAGGDPAHKEGSGWFDRLRSCYKRSLEHAQKKRRFVIFGALAMVVVALGSLKFIGTEFMPTLDEGSMIITSRRLPGISLSKSIQIGTQIEKTIRSFPEVTSVVTKLGRPDLATEAMDVHESDSYISFAPEKDWKCCHTKQELERKLESALNVIPGVAYEFTQPMQMRMDETITGTRGDLALKIFGPDLDTLDSLGHKAADVVRSVRGSSQTQMEQFSGAEEVQIHIDRAAAARYAVKVSDVQEVIESMYGSREISEIVEGDQRFSLAVRLPDRARNDLGGVRSLQLKAPTGDLVRLDQVADIRFTPGPILVNRENAHRRVVVMSNVSGRDLGSFVNECKQAVARSLPLPPGYHLEWGGQFENQTRAEERLMIVVPVSILIIAGLLYATFRNLAQTTLILGIVPLALVGGIAALWITGINLNLSASVGFIALFGIAVLNGVVMVSHINSLRMRGLPMREAVQHGAADRLRPVLITALVASLGFVPMALAHSRGAEVQRPLATVVIGGLFSATALTLYVLPLLYPRFSKHLPDMPEPQKKSA